MLTNNWKNMIRGIFQGSADDGVTDAVMRHPDWESFGADTYFHSSNVLDTVHFQALFLNDMPNVRTTTSANGVIFGNGTALPTAEDTNLSGSLITTIKATSTRSKKVNEDGSCVKTCVYTITNTGSDDIVISEIGYMGLLKGVYTYNDTASTNNKYCLLEHTLLEEPVTIPAGGVGQITYSVTFNVGID